jgi:hypothetical protein
MQGTGRRTRVLVLLVLGGRRRPRRSRQPEGITFVPLQEARQVPVGSFLDIKKGTVALQSSAGSKGKTYLGNFSNGLFQVLQSPR